MTKWEYKTLSVRVTPTTLDSSGLDELLAQQGQDGWDLLAVTPVLADGETKAILHHFRRVAEPERRVGFHA